MSVGLRTILPTPTYKEPRYTDMVIEDDVPQATQLRRATPNHIPPYGKRKGWVPKSLEDFGDGGAYPEILVAQYPFNMGRKNTGQSGQEGQIVSLTTDASGSVNYDAVVKQGHGKGVIVHTKNSATKEKYFDADELVRPTEEEESETAQKTLEMIQAKMGKKAAVDNPTAKVAPEKAKYIRYTPANQVGSTGASHRIIRMVEAPKDPLEPAKFKNTKSHGVPGSPPVPVLHSPPRNLSKEERDAWKIPPCISNWKNAKGYMIPLDKRVATDGRGLQDNNINDSFAKFSEALYIAERNAREEVTKRLNIQRELELRQQQEREEELRRIAQQARSQRNKLMSVAAEAETREERQDRIKREMIREERRLEREREARLANRGRESAKSKVSRDAQRDISEKIALTGVVPRTTESLFDSRLFNQSSGMDSGFGDDEDYNIYDKRLFGGERERALYKAMKPEEDALYGEAGNIDDLANAKKFKPHKDFDGVDRTRANPRSGPVQYEKDMENEEAFGLVSEFIKDVKEKKEREKGGDRVSLGVMHAVGGGAGGADDYRGKSSKKMKFVESSGGRDERDRREDRDRERRDRDRDRDYIRDDSRRDDRDRRDRDYIRDDSRRDDRDRRDSRKRDRY